MQYQALYRKLRPQRFSDVVGQGPIVTVLKNQIKMGRVAHAYLFSGSRGTGKTTLARILSRAINCMDSKEGEPCLLCPACQALSRENNMDVIEIDAASNNGVDEIRDLREKVKFPPSVGKYRVYIIDEVHMLSTGAFNALLKTLEEPPAHAVFILATTEPQRLPATVLSRCQRYDFRRISVADLVGVLRMAVESQSISAQPQALERIARAAQGGMRDALSTLDICLAYAGQEGLDDGTVRQVLGSADPETLFAFADALIAGDLAAALSEIDRMMAAGGDPVMFARDVLAHLRALLLAHTVKEGLSEILETGKEQTQAYRDSAKKASLAGLLRMMDLFISAESEMKWANTPRTVLELCAARACTPQDENTLEGLIQRVEALEGGKGASAPLAQAHSELQEIVERIARLEEGAPAQRRAAEKRTMENPAARPAEKGQAQPHVPKGADAPQGGAPGAGEAALQDAAPKALYEAGLKALKKLSLPAYAQLQRGEFLGMEDGAAVVAFPPGGEIHMRMLELENLANPVAQAMAEAFGGPVNLRMQVGASAPKPAAPGKVRDKEMLGEVFDLFGRENVEVLDE